MICNYIKYKKNCIPEDKIDEITVAMYLNIQPEKEEIEMIKKGVFNPNLKEEIVKNREV